MDCGRKGSGRLLSDGDDAPAGRASNAESLEYLSDMIEQLRGLAERAGFPTLAGLLDRAYLEATAGREDE